MKRKYVDLACSQWEDELHSFVLLEGVKFAWWEDQLKENYSSLSMKNKSMLHISSLSSQADIVNLNSCLHFSTGKRKKTDGFKKKNHLICALKKHSIFQHSGAPFIFQDIMSLKRDRYCYQKVYQRNALKWHIKDWIWNPL